MGHKFTSMKIYDVPYRAILPEKREHTMRNIIWALLLLGPIPAMAADPVFPYGAVYFRKSNPPSDDWERDH